MLEQLSHCWTDDIPLLKFDVDAVTVTLPLVLTLDFGTHLERVCCTELIASV